MKHLVCLAILLAASTTVLGAQEAKQPDGAEAIIRKNVESYVLAFNRADAKALAEFWTESGEFLEPGGKQLKGRPAIQKAFEEYFAETKGARIEVAIGSITFSKPDVALEQGRATVVLADGSSTQTDYTATHVRVGETWKMASVRETDSSDALSHYEQLKELGWMVGEWVDQDASTKIEILCAWTKNKSYLTRSYKVSVKDEVQLEGTQVIGWDPVAKTIRSWLFDSDGSFAEGTWTREKDRWVINSSHVLKGGLKASSINILTRLDDNSFTWQSVGREIAGEMLPNIEKVTVVRQQPGK